MEEETKEKKKRVRNELKCSKIGANFARVSKWFSRTCSRTHSRRKHKGVDKWLFEGERLVDHAIAPGKGKRRVDDTRGRVALVEDA